MNATQQAIELCELAKANFAHMIIGLKEVQCDSLPIKVMDYLTTNPGTTAFQLACLLVVLFPALVATPAFLALGFTPLGPMAGWLAAAFQSMYGTILPFRVLQSAAMGGWGAAIVDSIIQAGAVVYAGVMEVFKWCGGNGGNETGPAKL